MGVSSVLGAVFKKKKSSSSSSKAPDVTTPDAAAVLESAGADPYGAYQQRKRRSGRAQTILAGGMSPTALGTRTLLG